MKKEENPVFTEKIKSEAVNEISNVIQEDIQMLAKEMESYYSFFEGKRFLITGAFGFLGRYLVYLLKHLNENHLKNKVQALLLDNFVTGYQQKVITDENLKFVRHNVIEPFATDEKIDYIIHAAGIASPVYYMKYPLETIEVGTTGTKNMLELAKEKKVKSFLFTSSSEVYGDPDNDNVPTKEEYTGRVSIVGPRACYDESKRMGETLTINYWKIYDVPAKIVRPFNVYGPGIRPDDFRVLPNFIEHAIRKEPLPVHGKGDSTRSFCYISDTIEAFLKILFSDENGEVFNVGNDEREISVKELAEEVIQAMPYKAELLQIESPHAVYAKDDPKRRCPDIAKLRERIGFTPKYPLKTGLNRTIQWFIARDKN